MLFSQLRLNSPIYILHKDATPYVECGQVTNVTAPMPQIGTLPQLGQPLSYTVDVTVRIGDQTSLYQKLPANGEVADFASSGNVLLSCTREGINGEIHALHKQSEDVVSSVQFHKDRMQALDAIYAQLNPEVAEKEAQQREIDHMKIQMNDMAQNVSELVRQNSELMQKNSELMEMLARKDEGASSDDESKKSKK